MSSTYEAVKAWRKNPRNLGKIRLQRKRSMDTGAWKKWGITNLKEYRAKHQRRLSLKRNYRLTEGGFQALLLKQGGKCTICLREFSESLKPNVDHCHKTGRVRGLLCRSCNLLLGASADSAAVLERAVSYLQESGLVDTGP